MRIETVKCDNCDALRKEANHWWIVYRVETGGLMIVPFGTRVAFTNAALLVADTGVDLCGENCVAQYVSKNLSQDPIEPLDPFKAARKIIDDLNPKYAIG